LKALVKSYPIIRKYTDRIDQEIDDLISIEEPMEIRLQFFEIEWKEISLVVTMRTPGHDFDLASGFLFNEGIISNVKDILKVEYCSENEDQNVVKVQLQKEVDFSHVTTDRSFIANSSCGVCGKTSIEQVTCSAEAITEMGILFKEEAIFNLSEKISKEQIAFKYSGGIHASFLFDMGGDLLSVHEDIGRHNALDKAIGYYLRKEEKLDKKVLLVSGRLSYELTQKAAMARIPIIIAFGAPSSLAIDLAKELNITICGFAKPKQFNVYHDDQRILSI
jgi:FdhD protein